MPEEPNADLTPEPAVSPVPPSAAQPAEAGDAAVLDAALSDAVGASPSIGGPTSDEPVMPGMAAVAHPAEFPQLPDDLSSMTAGNIDLLMDVKLPVSIELGRTTLPIAEILRWGQGSIVELDRLAGEPVSLLVNNILVAKGEVVVVDENFGLRITSLIAPKDRVEHS